MKPETEVNNNKCERTAVKIGILFAQLTQTDVYLIYSSFVSQSCIVELWSYFKTCCMMGTCEAKIKKEWHLSRPRAPVCSIKQATQKWSDLYVTTFLPWVLPTGGVACTACRMAHIMRSMRAPSSSYIRPDRRTDRCRNELMIREYTWLSWSRSTKQIAPV